MARPSEPRPPPDDEPSPGSAIGARVDPEQPRKPEPTAPPKTPQPGHRPQLPVASFWRRLGAYLADAVVLFLANSLATRLTFGPPPQDIDPLAPESVEVLWPYYALNALIAWLYFAGTESSAWQATIGKRMLGLGVTDEAGEPISFARATGRYFGKVLSALPLGFGFLMILFTEKNQALHDRLASCLVLERASDPSPARNVEGLGRDTGP